MVASDYIDTWAILQVMTWPSLLHAWTPGLWTTTQVRKTMKDAEIPLKNGIWNSKKDIVTHQDYKLVLH